MSKRKKPIVGKSDKPVNVAQMTRREWLARFGGLKDYGKQKDPTKFEEDTRD